MTGKEIDAPNHMPEFRQEVLEEQWLILKQKTCTLHIQIQTCKEKKTFRSWGQSYARHNSHGSINDSYFGQYSCSAVSGVGVAMKFFNALMSSWNFPRRGRKMGRAELLVGCRLLPFLASAGSLRSVCAHRSRDGNAASPSPSSQTCSSSTYP